MSSDNVKRTNNHTQNCVNNKFECKIEKDVEENEKLENFSNWIHCICVVTFDLELGQAIEYVYPPQVVLSKQEASSICYLAFPDSNSGCMGNTAFSVRLKQNSVPTTFSQTHTYYNKTCPPCLQLQSGYYWGYVYFRQVKDPKLPRGYFQKSVVILSRLPFSNLFHKLNELIAPEYFNKGPMSLELACRSINQWPPPIPGETLRLPILGSVFCVNIPCQAISSQLIDTNTAVDGEFSILPSVTDTRLFEIMLPVLSHIYLLWELVLTAEPLIVMASSPTDCSAMVVALTSLITPFKFEADYRPYFTIHDSEFKEFTSNAHGTPHVILGVTNPFFSKTLYHWPHTIRLGEDGGIVKYKYKKNSNTKVLDSSPGLYTNYKPFLQKDKSFIKKLLVGVHRRPPEAQTALLRRNFLELAHSFMMPLERYVASLMPLRKNISAFKAAPTPLPFKPDEFLLKLETAGPQLTSGIKGDWEGLYQRFFKSPNFNGWYNKRYQDLAMQLQALQLQDLSDADLRLWVQDKPEVEVVDMVLKIKNKLSDCKEHDLPVSQETTNQLYQRLNDILDCLPEDLQKIFQVT